MSMIEERDRRATACQAFVTLAEEYIKNDPLDALCYLYEARRLANLLMWPSVERTVSAKIQLVEVGIRKRMSRKEQCVAMHWADMRRDSAWRDWPCFDP